MMRISAHVENFTLSNKNYKLKIEQKSKKTSILHLVKYFVILACVYT